MDTLNKKITLIKQDVNSKKISSVKMIASDLNDLTGESFVDCDLDSVLVLGNFGDGKLKEISSSEGFYLNELIPVVTVDVANKVLMQAFLNLESLSKTFETGFATYFSRSRNKIWLKGESSDNKQTIKKVFHNEKENFFVYEVEQKLAACHEGYYSCFFRKIEMDGSFKVVDFDRKFKPEKVYG